MRLLSALLLLATLADPSHGQAKAPWPVPAEIASSTFTVTLDGKPTPVMHAAENIYFLNFEAKHHLKVTVSAESDTQWAKGVEVEPWRLGIRPVRNGKSLAFTLDGPAKITLSQPNDVLAEAPTLFLFANPPEDTALIASRPGLRVYAPGEHHENIDAQSGDTIYLAPGAVVFGGLNLWQVSNVHVFGRGVIVYDGPQNPDNDDGWMHKKNWHCIVMDQAHDISIEGITCVVRSRTWQIQMKDSHNILFDNLKVIGANKGNANADGMDWLGGGDTVVRNSFFLAADDVFAMQSSWEGYGPVAFAVEGQPVNNVTVENTEMSTSISNIVRAGWPEKSFNGGHFHMRDSDVLHMGMGGCGIPFALMEFWADPHGRGTSTDYTFDNIRLEHWYSLTELMQQSKPGSEDGVSGAQFTNITAYELPQLVPSVLEGSVKNTTFANVNLNGAPATGDANLPVKVLNGAEPPKYTIPLPVLRIVAPAGLVKPGDKIKLVATASPDPGDLHYDWTFGDGGKASGSKPKHRFADAEGTLLDGSGHYRVIVHATNAAGLSLYASAPVVVALGLMPASHPAATQTGLISTASDGAAGVAATVSAAAIPKTGQHYTLTFDGLLSAPVDGGYTFTLIGNDAATLTLDNLTYMLPKPFAQVCGLAGQSARTVTLSAALAHGPHTLKVTSTHSDGQDDLRLLWQPPNAPVTEVPASAYSHP